MDCCCCIPSAPISSTRPGVYTFYERDNYFQESMMSAPTSSCSAFCWFIFQCNPLTCGCAQYLLRRKALEYDMNRYICCQGYFPNCLCFKTGECGESSCPHLCLCVEAHCCNGFAVSSTRLTVMEKYRLNSDVCDYRLIVINNWIQLFSCVFDALGMCFPDLRDCARALDIIADIVYLCTSGCMTSQVVAELNYQETNQSKATIVHAVPIATGYEEDKKDIASYQQI